MPLIQESEGNVNSVFGQEIWDEFVALNMCFSILQAELLIDKSPKHDYQLITKKKGGTNMKSGPASHLLSCPVVFISTQHENQRDIMVGTAMFVSEKESLLVVSLAKGHLTSQLIEKAGGFTVIAASEAQTDLYEQLADYRGAAADKFSALSIATIQSSPTKPPIPKGSAAWFECQTVAKQEIDNYTVIIARVTDHEGTENPPMIWQKEGLFTLKPL
jgi:flavin reductase (DIM6/NTAB) family NADH-FMN oxidoreductase RutF